MAARGLGLLAGCVRQVGLDFFDTIGKHHVSTLTPTARRRYRRSMLQRCRSTQVPRQVLLRSLCPLVSSPPPRLCDVVSVAGSAPGSRMSEVRGLRLPESRASARVACATYGGGIAVLHAADEVEPTKLQYEHTCWTLPSTGERMKMKMGLPELQRMCIEMNKLLNDGPLPWRDLALRSAVKGIAGYAKALRIVEAGVNRLQLWSETDGQIFCSADLNERAKEL